MHFNKCYSLVIVYTYHIFAAYSLQAGIDPGISNEQNEQIAELKRAMQEIGRHVMELEMHPQMPNGFVYVQLANTPTPAQLWPHLSWRHISSSYAGYFFRAEGGGSAGFGSAQTEFAPRITTVRNGNGCHGQSPQSVSLPLGSRSAWIWGGDDAKRQSCNDRLNLGFHTSRGEIRPKNQAVRIWQRV